MRPPRVKQEGGQFHIVLKDGKHSIDTDIKDKKELQKHIAKIEHYKTTKPRKKDRVFPIHGGLMPDNGLGLSNVQIEKIMWKLGAYDYGFQGCFASDKLDQVKPTLKPFSFILNTDTSKGPGVHWMAIYCSPKTEKELDIYDSFGRNLSKIQNGFQDRLLKGLKQMVDKLDLDWLLKMNMNYFQDQPDLINGRPSDTCGFYSMKFILDRINGESFREATDIDKLPSLIKVKTDEINDFKDELLNKGFI
jgi:hypothetical protein